MVSTTYAVRWTDAGGGRPRAAWQTVRVDERTSQEQTADAEAGPGADGEDLAAALRNAMRSCAKRLSGTPRTTIREGLRNLVEWADSQAAAPAPADQQGTDATGAAGAADGYDLDEAPDVYGSRIVGALEKKVAELLGSQDAAYFPTGTMAQQVALRCWSRDVGSSVVATHPLAHLEVHERHAYRDLTGLRGVWPATEPRVATADEVRACAEPFGVLALELPLRDAGFVLPSWDELESVTAAAHERGARVHFDGARLWETTAHFGRPLAEIAGLADSVYVSFYKSLGGISGAAVGGPSEFVAEMKTWRHRYGGQIYQQYPAVLSALIGIERELPRLPEYVAHAKTVARALADGTAHTPGIRVHPEPPHTHQFRVFVPFDTRVIQRAAVEQIADTGIGLFDWWMPAPIPEHSFTEVTVAAAALDWHAAEITAAWTDLLERAARIARAR
jgi:threonine aldolase